ncbi:hypothetical protein GCM10023157_15460 [Gluconacetobacter asukensis]
MNKNICAGQQSFKGSSVAGIVQIQPGALLPERDIRRHDGFFPSWRIDAENLGSPSRKKTGRDRTGQNPRQIQHAQTGERPFAIGPPSGITARSSPITQNQRLSRNGLAL